MTGTLNPPIPVIGQPNSIEDPVVKEALEKTRDGLNAILASDNTVDPALFNTANKIKFKWYEPKIIATEESRTNVAFGTLTTADEITNIVLNENALILTGYMSVFKQSVSEAARAAFFLGANQVKVNNGVVQETLAYSGTGNKILGNGFGGLQFGAGESFVTTGQILGLPVENLAGFTVIFAAAGTYALSVKFKSTSGSVTVKERKLWVATLG